MPSYLPFSRSFYSFSIPLLPHSFITVLSAFCFVSFHHHHTHLTPASTSNFHISHSFIHSLHFQASLVPIFKFNSAFLLPADLINLSHPIFQRNPNQEKLKMANKTSRAPWMWAFFIMFMIWGVWVLLPQPDRLSVRLLTSS